MKFRLAEGRGACQYYIGVEDDGYPRGLEPAVLAASVARVQAMARTLAATATLAGYLRGARGRRCALVRICLDARDEASYTDLRVAGGRGRGPGNA